MQCSIISRGRRMWKGYAVANVSDEDAACLPLASSIHSGGQQQPNSDNTYSATHPLMRTAHSFTHPPTLNLPPSLTHSPVAVACELSELRFGGREHGPDTDVALLPAAHLRLLEGRHPRAVLPLRPPAQLHRAAASPGTILRVSIGTLGPTIPARHLRRTTRSVRRELGRLCTCL